MDTSLEKNKSNFVLTETFDFPWNITYAMSLQKRIMKHFQNYGYLDSLSTTAK